MSKHFVATFIRSDATCYEHAMTISDHDAERLAGARTDKALLALKCIGLKEDQADQLSAWKVVDPQIAKDNAHDDQLPQGVMASASSISLPSGKPAPLRLDDVLARAAEKIPEQQFETPVVPARASLNEPAVAEDVRAEMTAQQRRDDKLSKFSAEDKARYLHLSEQLALDDDEQEELDAYELDLSPNKQDMADDLRAAKLRQSKDAYAAGSWAFYHYVEQNGDRPHLTSKADAPKLIEWTNGALELFQGGNPYDAIAYGDEGIERPAWKSGFNDAMRQSIFGRKQFHTIEEALKFVGDTSPVGEQIRKLRYPIGGHADMAAATKAAQELSSLLDLPVWPEDRGDNVRPRYGVIDGIRIGQPVSYGFNGDLYPCGFVIAMSGAGDDVTGWRIITTSDGTKNRQFWRRKQSGTWKHDETWSLVQGWHNDQNPSF